MPDPIERPLRVIIAAPRRAPYTIDAGNGAGKTAASVRL